MQEEVNEVPMYVVERSYSGGDPRRLRLEIHTQKILSNEFYDNLVTLLIVELTKE